MRIFIAASLYHAREGTHANGRASAADPTSGQPPCIRQKPSGPVLVPSRTRTLESTADELTAKIGTEERGGIFQPCSEPADPGRNIKPLHPKPKDNCMEKLPTRTIPATPIEAREPAGSSRMLRLRQSVIIREKLTKPWFLCTINNIDGFSGFS